MSEMTIDSVLGEYKADDYSVRLLETILKIVPGAPAYAHYRTVEDAVRALKPNATAADFAEARAVANDRDLKNVLWMAGLMDTGDQAYGVYTGIRSAISFFFGDRSQALETDNQQRNDAILKAFGLAYMVYNAYPGTMAEKVNAFRGSEAGQTLAVYYGAADIALPFADNVLTSGGNFIGDMIAKGGAAQTARLTSMAGGQSLDGAKNMLDSIIQPLENVAKLTSQYVKPIAEGAKQYVPSAMAATDKVAGVVATGADVLPVYRLLGARLAAESAARRALKLG